MVGPIYYNIIIIILWENFVRNTRPLNSNIFQKYFTKEYFNLAVFFKNNLVVRSNETRYVLRQAFETLYLYTIYTLTSVLLKSLCEK